VINDERRREDGTVTMMSGTYPIKSFDNIAVF
jgi:hypothetical protein